jgi:dethiobiotin synthetase
VVGRTALGTINHVALTLAEAARRRLRVAGYILNRTTPDEGPHESGNAEMITAVTGLAPLGTIPHLPSDVRDDDDKLADALVGALGPDILTVLLGSG